MFCSRPGPPVQLHPDGGQGRSGHRRWPRCPRSRPGPERPASWRRGRRRPAGHRGPPSGRARAGTRRRRSDRCRSVTRSASTSSQGGFCFDPPLRAPSSTGSATLASPQTTRASSRPRATRRSSPAMSRASLRPADAVVEGDPLVPDRVPDLVGDGRDVLLALMDEDHVEVAERAQLTSSVATHGHQGHPSGLPVGGLVEQVRSATRRPPGRRRGRTHRRAGRRRSMSVWRRARRDTAGPYHRPPRKSGSGPRPPRRADRSVSDYPADLWPEDRASNPGAKSTAG